MKRKVQFDINVPENISEEELWDYLRYTLDFTGSMPCDNPLENGDIDQLSPSNLQIY